MKTIRLFLACLGLLTAVRQGHCQQMPQDNWIYEGKRVLGSFRAMHIAQDNRIYVGSTNKIAVLDTDLNFLAEFGTVGTVLGIASDSQTNIYVLEASTVKVYNPVTGDLVNQWGSAGSADGNFTIPAYINASSSTGTSQPQVNGIAIDQNDNVYLANFPQMLVMTTNGTFVRKWSMSPGQTHPFYYPQVVGISKSGEVVVVHGMSATQLIRQFFKPDGTFISSLVIDPNQSGAGGRQVTLTPDGLLLIGYRRSTVITILDGDKKQLGEFSPFTSQLLRSEMLGNGLPDLRADGLGVSADGDLYINVSNWEGASPGSIGIPRGLVKLKRLYSKDHIVPTPSFVPQPRLVAAVQRPLTTYVDLDYVIRDTDSPQVSVRALAFTNGVNTLTGLIKLNTFVEGTAANLGSAITANVTNRLTWDAAADWNVGFGSIQFEILAQDARELLPFHFITVPGTPVLKVSDKPVTDADLLSAWFWLIASNDPEITFVNGVVRGVNAPYAGVTLASGIATTSQGRSFLFGRMGIRAIDSPAAGEVARANGGRYGFPATVTSSHVVKID